jgi:enamine deaminase RidA (YjgF/YER057c/UK114 family)
VAAGKHLLHIAAPEGVAAARAGGFSQVVAGAGRLVLISGQVAFDADGALVGKDDPAGQTRQVFENLRRCLAAVGATFDDVVKLNYYLTDIYDLPDVREIRDEFIDTERPPASTAVQVVALALPDLLIEVEALALLAE